MKAKLLSIFVFMLLTTSVFGIVINAEEESLSKEIFESIVFSEPKIQKVDQYISINIEEATSQLMQPGRPNLPICSKIFKFPFGTEIEDVVCRPSQVKSKIISAEIKPSPEPVLMDNINKNEEKNFAEDFTKKDNTIYKSMEFFPNSWYDYRVGCGLDETSRVVYLRIELYPVRYSPGKNTIKYANAFEISVEYKEKTNPAEFKDEYDMVIITHSDFTEKLQSLVDYKIDSGVQTKLVTLNDIYDGTYFEVEGRDNPERIKYFIKNAIEEWNITYVLLSGGINKVPGRLSYAQDGEEINFVSDLYYADIYDSHGEFCSWDSNGNDYFGEYYYQGTDEVDLYPDVMLGRLNFRSIDEVDGVINKLVTYESTGAYMEYWFSDFTVCGGDTFPDSNIVCEGEYLNEFAIGLMDGFTPERIWVTNGKLKFAINIDSALENGTGFLYMTGHGTHENWVTHPENDFETWWPLTGYFYFRVDILNNGEKLPVVVIGGCSNCQFTGSHCFGWSFVKNPDGGGIASYGYSALGWGYPGHGCASGLTGGMEMSAFKAYGDFEAKTTGELWVNAINNYLNEFGAGGAHSHKCIEEFQPFNDPALRIRKVSDKPNIPTIPDGPDYGGVGIPYEYNTMSTDPNGGYIKYCYDWGDGSNKWTDWYSSGQTASLKHSWEKPGVYEIRTKARDHYGLDSDWSEPFEVTIISETPFLDIIKVKGGIGKVNATIKNIGMLDAVDVTCNITVTGGFFGLINKFAEETFETLPVDEEKSMSVSSIFGIGKIDILVVASSPSANTTSASLQGFALGPIVLIKK